MAGPSELGMNREGDWLLLGRMVGGGAPFYSSSISCTYRDMLI